MTDVDNNPPLPGLAVPRSEHEVVLEQLRQELVLNDPNEFKEMVGYPPEDQKAILLERIIERKEILKKDAKKEASALLEACPAAAASEQVRQFFANGSEATSLLVYSTDTPYDDLSDLLSKVEEIGTGNFVTIGTTEPIAPPLAETIGAASEEDEKKRLNGLVAAVANTDKASRALSRSYQRGLPAQLLAPFPSGPFEEFAKAMAAGANLLGSAEGRENIQVFTGKTTDPDGDPDLAFAAVPIGALLRRRSVLDRKSGVGEPMMGDRGGKGALAAGIVIQGWIRDHRDIAVKYGVNPLMRWQGVGESVVDGDRTLLDGSSVYIYSSRVRLRNWIASVFYKLVSHHLYGDGGGPESRLELALAAMNLQLKILKEQKWIQDGKVTPDYGANDLILNIDIEMGPVRDRITLNFRQMKLKRDGAVVSGGDI